LEITYIANEGFLLSCADKRIMIDSLLDIHHCPKRNFSQRLDAQASLIFHIGRQIHPADAFGFPSLLENQIRYQGQFDWKSHDFWKQSPIQAGKILVQARAALKIDIAPMPPMPKSIFRISIHPLIPSESMISED